MSETAVTRYGARSIRELELDAEARGRKAALAEAMAAVSIASFVSFVGGGGASWCLGFEAGVAASAAQVRSLMKERSGG